MEKTAPDQICDVCGKIIPGTELNVNVIFDIARCKPCLEKYGAVPLETLKASLISTHGLKVKDIPKDKWHELILLQKKKWDLKLDTDKKIEKTKGSILNIGRESKIEKIKQDAAEERKKISQEIEDIIIEIKNTLKQKEESV